MFILLFFFFLHYASSVSIVVVVVAFHVIFVRPPQISKNVNNKNNNNNKNNYNNKSAKTKRQNGKIDCRTHGAYDCYAVLMGSMYRVCQNDTVQFTSIAVFDAVFEQFWKNQIKPKHINQIDNCR